MISPTDPERALALAYAPAAARPALSALFRLDEQLGVIVARTEQPAVGQMRLTWWHDALSTLRSGAAVDPLLVELAAMREIEPATLLPLIDGWEVLLDPLPLSADQIERFGELRGAALFRAAGGLLGGVDPEACAQAGQLWSLVDLAFRVSDRTTAERALSLAPVRPRHLPRALRVLARLADHDRRRGLDRPRLQGSPRRVLRAVLAGLGGV